MIKFGTDGWRSVVADGFTFNNLRLVTHALSDYLKGLTKEPSVVVGYDNRFMGKDFAAEVAEVFAADGVRVILGDTAYPTPVVAYAVKSFAADGAVMLTASHNPYQYNGLKFIPDYSGPATEEITAAIEMAIEKRTAHSGTSTAGSSTANGYVSILKHDLSRKYVRHVLDLLNTDLMREARLKVGLDPCYGAGNRLLPELAAAAGLRVTVMHDQADPLFGGMMPDPSEQNLTDLRGLVLKEGLALGLALDGDADRFGVIADDGSYLTPNQVMAILLIHMFENRELSGAVVRTVATTHLIDAIAERFDLELIETPVGFKHIGQLMRDRPVLIGGEESGGLSVLGHIPEKDGLLADMLMCEMVVMSGKKLSEIWTGVVSDFGEYHNLRIDIHIAEKRKIELLSSLKKHPPRDIGGLKVKQTDSLDGIRFNLENDAWLLIRPSGTEPLIRAYIEAKSQSDMRSMEYTTRKMFRE